jgi:hypothetical protein
MNPALVDSADRAPVSVAFRVSRSSCRFSGNRLSANQPVSLSEHSRGDSTAGTAIALLVEETPWFRRRNSGVCLGIRRQSHDALFDVSTKKRVGA